MSCIMEEKKKTAYEATKIAMRELSGALIATSMVLCAVFIPVSFLSGISGQLYRQFTITIVVSVVISTVVALTLSPAMCARILRPVNTRKQNLLFRYINVWLHIGNKKYVGLVNKSLAWPKRIMTGFALTLIAIFVMHNVVPKSFMPLEDQGYFKVELELPQGATLQRTRMVTERAISYLMSLPYVEYVQNVTGNSSRAGNNQARAEMTVILKSWKERKKNTIEDIMSEVKAHLSRYPEAKVYISTPPVIPGLGSSGGFEMVLEARGDASIEELQAASDTLIYYAQQYKELTGVSSSLQPEVP